ncbi:MAG: cyclopropane-fatty-acyl-phospholipid synthase family protein [Acidobacteriota bacterium]|nr:cyclopropane-fatty-acyl-phospholipid synthase family protein [Acidobacteriota bacterium]
MTQLNQSVWGHSSEQTKSHPTNWKTSLARRAFFSLLSKIQYGHLLILDGNESFVFGGAKSREISATIRILDPSFYLLALLRGSIGAAEAYMKGYWHCENLTEVVRLFIRNQDLLKGFEGGIAHLGTATYQLHHRFRKNTRRGSKHNISNHYDLGNDFFALFLGPGMSYSCEVFPKNDSSMAEASREKNDRICRKLKLSEQDHLLEIGSGWGSFALHAARYYGCRVTTTTISQQQYDWTLRLVHKAELANLITVSLKDYRNLEGHYSKLASIEMIEAVGHEYLKTYFQKCSQLLDPGGRMVIQSIAMADRHFENYRQSVDFIQSYIFPGCALPSVGRIVETIAKKTDLAILGLEDITSHYPPTLRNWRTRFLARVDQVRSLGYSDNFIRMWEFYFCYCEAGFLERHIQNFQFSFAKPSY